VNILIKEAGLSNPVGRPPKKKRKKANISQRTKGIILKAVDSLFKGEDSIFRLLSKYKLLPEGLNSGELFQDYLYQRRLKAIVDTYSNSPSLNSPSKSEEEEAGDNIMIPNELQSEIYNLFVRLSEKVHLLKIVFGNGKSFYFDPYSRSLYTHKDLDTYSVSIVEGDYRHIPDPSNPFGVGGVSPSVAGYTVTRNYKLNETPDDYQGLSEVKYVINGETVTAPGGEDGFKTSGFVKGIDTIEEKIENVKKKLPSCQFECLDEITGRYYSCTYQEAVNNTGAKVANPVCYTGRDARDNLIDFGSIDEDMDDEFKIAEADIGDIINRLNSFKESAKDAYTEMNNVKVAEGIKEWGGKNPVTYSWRDSRGEHSVSVEVSEFKIPKLKAKKSFFKVCAYIKHKEGKDWVSIKREEPANKEISAGGIFSFLGNPFSSSNNIEIWRTGRAEFHYKHVKLEKGGRKW